MQLDEGGTTSGHIVTDWLDRSAELASTFRDAQPFPMLVLDNFLDEDFAQELLDEFPAVDAMPKSRDYVFGDKHELSSVRQNGPASASFYDELLGDRFRKFLCDISGLDLFVDPAFHGGGFHQGSDGSFLDMHVDFNVHPLHSDWLRTLNILLYLNRDWKPEYGGDLVVKNGIDGECVSVAPVFNRAIIMVTDDRTFHGYKKMSLPAGVTRKSIATYAYQLGAESVMARTTGWAPENANLGKKLLARHYDRAVKMKNRVFGSATAKNR